jgi:type II secretory ATPase GspE/PulE/Tfp pilus assembly ATPase PilB-like protein
MLQTLLDIPHKTYEGIVSQVKLQSHLKMGGKKLPQDGQYSFLVNKKTIDIRVSCMPGVFGESLVLRILDSRKGIVSLKDLGYETYQLEILAKILSFPYGMVLVAGPTGSGKTSTLYSLLKVLNTETRKILTLEDPVEYTFEGVFQSEITEEYSFFQGLKSALRQDPDIIMLGEIRDYEVALTAFQASQTGHFVLSSLHANSAIEVFSRLKNLEIPAYLITPSLLSVVSQRLLRTVCPHCSAKRPFTKEQKIFLEPFYTSFFSQGIFSEIFPEQEVYGKGCEECNFTGYKGRTVASEVLFVSDTLKEMVRSNASLKEFTEQAKKEGFIFMKENACLKVLQGKTSLEEVLRVFG